MKKRVVLLLLALFLLLPQLPAAAAADGSVTMLIVDDVDVLACADPADVFGDGTVAFDARTGVLTLSDARITKGVSAASEEWAESPGILFLGDLTIHLRGRNTISSGTTRVMGQSLRNNAITGGDRLTITAEPGASLAADGMFQMSTYVQKSGTVAIEFANDHTMIEKWAMYAFAGLSIEGGSFSASSVGRNRSGAVMLDENRITIADGARIHEGGDAADEPADRLTVEGSGPYFTKNCVRVELPDAETPAPVRALPFKDVPADAYYKDAVLWALDEEVTQGTSADAFSPLSTCTRGQVVTFLWRASGRPEPKSEENPFRDVHADDYFYRPVLWAVEQGITVGTSADAFSPSAPCTSAQVVTFLWRANGSPEPSEQTEDGAPYYVPAVSWAEEREILSPDDPEPFKPDAPSPRADIVTWLYRNAGSPAV